MKKIFYFCLIMFCFTRFVYADEVVCDSEKDKILITDKNNCISNNSVISNSSCNGSRKYFVDPDKPLDVSYSVPKNVPVGSTKPFKVFVLVDDSNSMSTGNKIENVKGSLKNLAIGVKQINDNSRIIVKYFNSDLTSEKKITSYYDAKDYNKVSAGDKATDYVTGLKKAYNYFNTLKNGADKDKYVPLVVFITDGYPNVLSTGPKGYASSARHFYNAAKEFNKVRNLINSIDNNAKIITVGIDIGGDTKEDYMPNYLLNPTDVTYEKLRTALDVDGNTNLESKKYYEMMNAGTGDKTFKEVVMTIAAYPDYGLVGSADSTTNKKMFFKNIGVLKNNVHATLKSTHFSQGGGLIFGPFKKHSGFSSSDFTVKYDGHTLSRGNNKFEVRGSSNWKYFGIKFSSNSQAQKILNAQNVVISVKNNKTLEYNTYKREGTFSHDVYKGAVDKYFPKVLTDIPVDSWKDALTSNGNNSSKTCESKSVMGGKQRDHKGLCETKDVAIGRFCYNGSGRDVSVPIVLDESTTFDGGTIKDLDDSVIAGRGFKFQNISLINTVEWQFLYKGIRSSVPNVSNQVPLVKFGEQYVKFDELKLLSGGCTNNNAFNNIQDLKNVIDKKLFDTGGVVYNYSNNLKNDLEDGFETVDFNDKDKTRKDLVDVVDYSVDSINNGKKYSYIIAAKRIMSGGRYKFKYADSSVLDDELSTPGVDRYYYLPFGYDKSDAIVNVNFNSFVKYEVICPIKVGTKGYPEKHVTYRSIDIEDPFPKSGYNYNNIPANWRDWYCDGTGCLNTIFSNNKNRLKSSYNKIFYEVSMSNLKQYNETGNYSLIDSIDGNGNSSFISENNYFNINNAIVNKNYCKYGEWNKTCDEVG